MSSQRYIPHDVTLKKRQKWTAFYVRCKPSAGPRGSSKKNKKIDLEVVGSIPTEVKRYFSLPRVAP